MGRRFSVREQTLTLKLLLSPTATRTARKSDLFASIPSPKLYQPYIIYSLTVVTVYLKGAIKNYVTMYAIIPNPLWSFD